MVCLVSQRRNTAPARARPAFALLGALAMASCASREESGTLGAGAIAREAYAVTDDSVRLWYRIVGSGAETVLAPNALFHGTRLDSVAVGRRVVLFDTRGRGRSDTVPSHKISLRHNLIDVETIRRAVGADRVALVGWSGMGMELFVYALRNPERVTRLVQLAPVAPRWVPYSSQMMQDRRRRTDSVAIRTLNERVERGEYANDPARLCRDQARVFTPATFGDTSLARLAPDVCDNPTEWPSRIGAFFGTFLGSIEGFDWRDSLSAVTVPRLVIHGELDNTPLAGNEEWVAGQPQRTPVRCAWLRPLAALRAPRDHAGGDRPLPRRRVARGCRHRTGSPALEPPTRPCSALNRFRAS
jgi:pimeloyl-ACP methyl ester carboxylesterase